MGRRRLLLRVDPPWGFSEEDCSDSCCSTSVDSPATTDSSDSCCSTTSSMTVPSAVTDAATPSCQLLSALVPRSESWSRIR